MYAIETYLFVVAMEEPDKLNNELNSVILSIAYFNVWNLTVFASSAVFFAGRPKRRRIFWKWIREIFLCARICRR